MVGRTQVKASPMRNEVNKMTTNLTLSESSATVINILLSEVFNPLMCYKSITKYRIFLGS